jgi:hypothetical protein
MIVAAKTFVRGNFASFVAPHSFPSVGNGREGSTIAGTTQPSRQLNAGSASTLSKQSKTFRHEPLLSRPFRRAEQAALHAQPSRNACQVKGGQRGRAKINRDGPEWTGKDREHQRRYRQGER